jgi:hypothetical protein
LEGLQTLAVVAVCRRIPDAFEFDFNSKSLYAAAPSLALATLALTIVGEGASYAAIEARSNDCRGNRLLRVRLLR